MPIPAEIERAITATWRLEAAKIVAHIARITRDVSVAEELAQDCLLAALQRWPQEGLPDKPAAWLIASSLSGSVQCARINAAARSRPGLRDTSGCGAASRRWPSALKKASAAACLCSTAQVLSVSVAYSCRTSPNNAGERLKVAATGSKPWRCRRAVPIHRSARRCVRSTTPVWSHANRWRR